MVLFLPEVETRIFESRLEATEVCFNTAQPPLNAPQSSAGSTTERTMSDDPRSTRAVATGFVDISTETEVTHFPGTIAKELNVEENLDDVFEYRGVGELAPTGVLVRQGAVGSWTFPLFVRFNAHDLYSSGLGNQNGHACDPGFFQEVRSRSRVAHLSGCWRTASMQVLPSIASRGRWPMLVSFSAAEWCSLGTGSQIAPQLR